VGGVIDLKASKSCMLSLLDTNAPTGRSLTPDEVDHYTVHVILPGTATVSVDGFVITIPEGQQRWVRSQAMTYKLL
jgi:hypothetical protein